VIGRGFFMTYRLTTARRIDRFTGLG